MASHDVDIVCQNQQAGQLIYYDLSNLFVVVSPRTASQDEAVGTMLDFKMFQRMPRSQLHLSCELIECSIIGVCAIRRGLE